MTIDLPKNHKIFFLRTFSLAKTTMKEKILVVAEKYTDIYTKTQNWVNLAHLALQDLDRGIAILSIEHICLYSSLLS